ncbi:MAG: RnfH family protein [Betaproteobacteria bacterium]
MKLRIEVVYALADVQTVISLELEPGARVADALAAAQLSVRLPVPGGAPEDRQIGIWGNPSSLNTELRDCDRVEIYRDLAADPKQARRQRARQQRLAGRRR